MKTKIIVVGFLALSLAGCATVAKDFTAQTTATYSADGSFSYQSSKNQENFKGDVTIDPVTNRLTGLHVETNATTPEAAIAAASQANAATAQLLNKLLDKLSALAPAALAAGS